MNVLKNLLLRWEGLFSAARHNQFLLLHAGILLIGLARPLGESQDPEAKARIRKQITESAWEMKNNVQESRLSAMSRWCLLREIDKIVVREMRELG
jgi:hypothetical protein